MKILSRILIALLLLAGLAFLVIQNRAHAADEAKKCQGSLELKLGLDTRNCECVDPEQGHGQEAAFKGLLKAAGIGEECYKIKHWEDHNVVQTWGTLDDVKCLAKEGDECPKYLTRQPIGTSYTQRVMFNSSQAMEAFKRQAQATPSPTPTKK